MSGTPPPACRHGAGIGCPDCLELELNGVRQWLEDPDARYFFSRATNLAITAQAAAVTNDIRAISPRRSLSAARVHAQVPMQTQIEPPFLSPHHERSATPSQSVPVRLSGLTTAPAPQPKINPNQPVRVVGSAFASDPSVTAIQYVPQSPTPSSRPRTPLIRDTLAVPERLGLTVSQHVRKYFRKEESDMLVEAYHVIGPKWETIRRQYPALYRFSGMQLKDHYRHLCGRKTGAAAGGMSD